MGAAMTDVQGMKAPATPRAAGLRAVLMYHAVKADGSECPGGAEANYTVSRSEFESHLRQIAAAGKRAASVQSIVLAPGDPAPERAGQAECVYLTFDDGHASNGAAAELLAAQGGTADFFVNPSTVGQPDFLSWAALRDMAAAGMSIQSHGMHHHYLDQLTPAEVERELRDSKNEIEARLGTPVTLFAPPGGRQPEGFAETAGRAGYLRVCSSRAGYWQAGHDGIEVPRLAVLSTTGAAQLDRWVRLDPGEMAWQQRRYRTLRAAKNLLGNRSYDAVRGLLLRIARR